MEAAQKLLVHSAPCPPIQTHKTNLTSTPILKTPFSNRKNQASLSLVHNRKRSLHCCTNSVAKDGFIVSEKPKVERKNLAVFVSGGGSNFKSIHEATVNGIVHGDIVVLVTSNDDCGGAEYARSKNIPVIVFPKRKGAQGLFSGRDLATALRSYKVDFVLLAGYLKLIPPELIQAYPKSIFNIHPSLLPAFGGKGYYGMKVHRAVIASGARYSGATIHYVDEEYDTGRIVAQRVVPVLASDKAEDLATRILHQEHQLYVEVSAALCDERIIWREDGVPLIQSKENPDDYRNSLEMHSLITLNASFLLYILALIEIHIYVLDHTWARFGLRSKEILNASDFYY